MPEQYLMIDGTCPHAPNDHNVVGDTTHYKTIPSSVSGTFYYSGRARLAHAGHRHVAARPRPVELQREDAGVNDGRSPRRPESATWRGCSASRVMGSRW